MKTKIEESMQFRMHEIELEYGEEISIFTITDIENEFPLVSWDDSEGKGSTRNYTLEIILDCFNKCVWVEL